MRPYLSLLLLSLCGAVTAQTDYFQQRVAYDIEVLLDDRRHELHGHLRLKYVNNSPDTLREIYFHLWPRAYSDRSGTAFARQQLRNAETEFYFSDPTDRGDLDSLDFRFAGFEQKDLVEWQFPANPDIVYLEPYVPLAPGDSTVIVTPFRVRIPQSFSRLGRVGESYQITQWYPKPAVYDRDGWHYMPYLDQGEFYGEFATYDVRITLPENYTVGATGELQTDGQHGAAGAAELTRLKEKSAADRAELTVRAAAGDLATDFVAEDFPPSSPATKTLHYRAERVHDFAWFADKRFRVLHDTLQLDGRPEPVDVWALFTETEAAHWVNAVGYLKRATRFYSERLGVYPYPQVTGVQSALSAGGGMEYPMITVIDRGYDARALDEVLAHEVGHNWFYGILASNERDHPWLDEGLTSYYEQRYVTAHYPQHRYRLAGRVIDPDLLAYRFLARQGGDQAPDTSSDSLVGNNYWVAAYSKPVLLLERLERAVGRPVMDRLLRAYYERWRFRHPGPEDFFAVVAEFVPPAQLAALRTGLLTDEPQTFPGPSDPRAPGLSLSLVTDQDRSGTAQLFALPFLGFNEHDGPLLGGILHNRTLEPQRLEWALAPLYGFESRSLNGFAGLRYRLNGLARGANFNLGYQRFSDFTLRRTDEPYGYRRLAARFELPFAHEPVDRLGSGLTLQLIGLSRTRPVFGDSTEVAGNSARRDLFARLTYQRHQDDVLRPTALRAALEYYAPDETTPFRQPHLRVEAEYNGAYQYERDRFFRYRLFGGYFLVNELRDRAVRVPTALALVDNAATDYRYDDLYLGRNFGGIYGQQLERRQGGFRAPIGGGQPFGSSNNYLFALNLDARLPALPAALPLGVYLDAGYYGTRPLSAEPETGRLSWVGGLSLTALGGRIGVFAPLVGDPDTRLLLQQEASFLNRLSVRLNLTGYLPWRWLDDLR